MVFVNSTKYACESCIKGHRSSSCHHTDRPLFEIKKKGRPVSQCTSCRQLRQSKKLHSKCTCDHRPEANQVPMQPVSATSTSKTKRYIPITPSLPNGLKDALSTGETSPADARQRVDTLLNPCSCKGVMKCKCVGVLKRADIPTHDLTTGLSALADAAATIQSCCSSSSPSEASLLPSTTFRMVKKPSRPRSPMDTQPKKRRRHEKHPSTDSSGFDLPPLLYGPVPLDLDSSQNGLGNLPDFGFMAPPMSLISSLAGSGCTCGVQCACPGCAEHRGSHHASHDRRSCGDGCGTCIDPSLGLALPQTGGAASSTFVIIEQTGFNDQGFLSTSSESNSIKESFLDKFFARAAALPPPPQHRRMSTVNIDPMDTSVYLNVPQVNLPKLECCGGQCTCPNGQCSCQESCVGCGEDGHGEASRLPEPMIEQRFSESLVVAKSCCASG